MVVFNDQSLELLTFNLFIYISTEEISSHQKNDELVRHYITITVCYFAIRHTTKEFKCFKY